MWMNPVNQPLRLCQSSSIQISKRLWTQLDLRIQLVHCIDEFNIWSFTQKSTQVQDTLCGIISSKVDKLALSASLSQDLKRVVGAMGTRMQQWILKLGKNGINSVDLAEYFRHLQWTYHGCIDESATVHSMYLSHALPYNFITWLELCDHCLEDDIRDLWPKLLERTEGPRSLCQTVLSSYWCYRLQNDLETSLDDLESIIPHWMDDQSLDENLFAYSFLFGTCASMKYFWGLMSDDQRKAILSRVCEVVMDDIDLLPKPDILYFLVQQIFFYKQNHLWMLLLLSKRFLMKFMAWPYEELFLHAVDESWERHGPMDYTPILVEMTKSMEFLFSQESIIFDEIVERVVDNNKGRIDFVRVLNESWEMENIKMMNCIINSPRLTTLRDFHTSVIIQAFKGRPYFLKSDFGDRFLNDVFASETEREWFRCQVTRQDD
ncbi:uncharacterized protein LOC135162954 isoform X1 [Diachasmimorpha longicaudata]|uniref:uncharacterized protein LOC135162954 isoform X1 n=1 Tax=Diachasmimorpha longicaudata TaxID=58733 RepID=UPI0030B8EE10